MADLTEQLNAEALIGKMVDGRYTIQSILGQGGMGVVFRALQNSVQRSVAMKTLHPQLAMAPTFFERFRREAEVASRLHHPNIITVFDFGKTSDGLCYYVMEMLEGESLRQRIRREGPLSVRQAVAIIEQIALGVGHAHKQGVVHRDLKPHNVMLTLIDGNEYVKVLDFGLVKAMEQEEEEQQLTSTGQVLGTPQYMPPEQAGGERVDARGDLYSLTGVLYFCLTGHSPFGANTVRKALQAALTQRPPPIATHRKGAPVPEAIDRFCIKGLDPEPDARFQSCEAFIEALHAAIASASDEVLDAIPERVAEASKEVGAGSSGASKREGSSARSSRLMSVAAVPKSKSPLPGAAPVSSRENPTRGERPPSPDAPNRRSASALAVAAVSAVLVAIIVTSIGLRLMRGPPSAAPQGVGATATRASPAGPSPAVAVRTTGSETPSVKDEPKEPTSDLQPQNIRIALKTVPPGAEVVEEGVTLGTTPLSIEWTRAQKRSLTFKLSGYRTLEKALRPESDQAFEFILEAKKSKSPGKNSPAKPSEDDINTFE